MKTQNMECYVNALVYIIFIIFCDDNKKCCNKGAARRVGNRGTNFGNPSTNFGNRGTNFGNRYYIL